MGHIFWFSAKSAEGALWLLRARTKGDVKKNVSEPMVTVPAKLPGSKWSLLLLTFVMRTS